MALKDLLDSEIKKTLSQDEQDIYALDALIAEEANKVQSDFGRKAFEIIEVTILNADKASIDELQLRLTRLTNLKKYTKEAKIGETEQQIVESSITEAEKTLQKQLDNKKSWFGKTKKLISQNTIDMGALLIGISAGDPLVALGVKLGGDFLRSRKEKKLEAEQNKKDTIRGDAESLKGSDAPRPAPMGGGPLARAPMFDDEDEGYAGPSFGGKGGSSDNGALLNVLQDIFLFTEEISDDVKTLVAIAQGQEVAAKNQAFDNLEASRESGVGGGLVRSKEGGAKEQKKGILGNIASMLGMGGGAGAGNLLMMIGKYGLIAGAAGAVLYGAYDIISSYITTGKFGNSDTEKLIKGLDEGLINAMGSLGEGAKAGAAEGSAILPLGGTIVGGLFGMMMEGVTGWLGDAAPDLGASNPFQAGIFSIFDIILSSVHGMLKSTFDALETILQKLPGYESLGINTTLKAARKKVLGMTEPASAMTSSNQQEAVEKQYRTEEDELDFDYRNKTGNFSNDRMFESDGTAEDRYKLAKKTLAKKRTRAMEAAKTADVSSLQRSTNKPPGGSSVSTTPQSQAPTSSGDGQARISADKGKAILISAMDKAGITDPTERAAFMAQMSHESMGYTRLLEMASGEAYEGRKNLGNTEPGDGKRFKGRGFVQLTGRSNYQIFGKAVGLDLVNNPQWASDPNVAADLAVAYWNQRVKPSVSNFSNIDASTKAINGGMNGAEDRRSRFAKTLADPSITAVSSSPPMPAASAPTALAAAAAPAPSGTLSEVNNATGAVQMASLMPPVIINNGGNQYQTSMNGGSGGGPTGGNIPTTSLTGSAVAATGRS